MSKKAATALLMALTMGVTQIPGVAMAGAPADDSNASKAAISKNVSQKSNVASGKLGDSLNWTLNGEGVLKVTGSGAMYNYGEGSRMDSPIKQYADKITSVELSEGMTTIGKFALGNLEKVTGCITIPSTVKTINYCAFTNCGMEKVVFPDSVTSIGELAFSYCHNLKEFNIPVELKTLNTSAFDGCHKVETVTSKAGSKNYIVQDNVVYNKGKTTLVYYPPGKVCSNVVVPSGVKKIENMKLNKSIETVALPEGLTEIGYGAFGHDRNLMSISMPSTLKKIGDSAFYNCHALKEADIPASCSSIGVSAFLFTTALEKVTIRSKTCLIKNINADKKVVIYGYSGSTAHKFAEKNGYEFRDISSGKTLVNRMDNKAFINSLPKTGFSAVPPMSNVLVYSSGADDEVLGYSFDISASFTGASASVKSQVKEKSTELCRDKNSDLEKARAIYSFVRDHMTYKQYPYGLETAWKNGVGNCMTYAELTSAMLYYAGLPNGYAFENGHMINIVLCDGRWVCIDSQGKFDYDPNEYEDITTIAIMSNDMVFVIDDATGVKLTQIGYDSNKADNALKKRGVTIPSWIKGYYTEGWSDMYKGMVIRGTKGSLAEKMVRELGYNSISYKGNSFIAKMAAIKTPAKPKVKIKGMKGKIKIRYTKAKNATGFQVSYKKAGAKKYKSKQFNCRKSAVRTIKKLRPGKYSVKVRSIRKADGKTIYSKWTKVKKVRVK